MKMSTFAQTNPPALVGGMRTGSINIGNKSMNVTSNPSVTTRTRMRVVLTNLATFDMSAFIFVMQYTQTNREKTVQLCNLHTFGGQPQESAEFMLRYERGFIVHNWNDRDKPKCMNLACEKGALQWREANKVSLLTFTDLKKFSQGLWEEFF